MSFQGLPQIKIIAEFLLIVCNDAKWVRLVIDILREYDKSLASTTVLYICLDENFNLCGLDQMS